MIDREHPVVIMALNEFARAVPEPRTWRVTALQRDAAGQWYMELAWYERRVKICFEPEKLSVLRDRLTMLA